MKRLGSQAAGVRSRLLPALGNPLNPAVPQFPCRQIQGFVLCLILVGTIELKLVRFWKSVWHQVRAAGAYLIRK